MTKKIVIHSNQVKETRQDGIVYIDNEGDEQFIDFEVCYQNYLQRRLSPEAIESYKKANNLTDDDLPEYFEHLKNWQVIGGRNYSGDRSGSGEYSLPYLDFFVQPTIRVEFPNQYEFLKIERTLARKFKWRTIDYT